MSTDTITKHVQDVLTYIKRQFGDESGAQITDADIIGWINLAQLEIATTSKCLHAVATGPTVVGQYDYQLPEGFNAIEIVTMRYNGAPLTGLEFGQMEQSLVDRDPLRTVTGTPQLWTKFGSTVTLWPTPEVSTDAGLTIYYYASPADISSAGDALSLPDRYYSAILFYCMSKASELDEDFSTAQTYYQTYQQKLGESIDEEDQALNLFYPSVVDVDYY